MCLPGAAGHTGSQNAEQCQEGQLWVPPSPCQLCLAQEHQDLSLAHRMGAHPGAGGPGSAAQVWELIWERNQVPWRLCLESHPGKLAIHMWLCIPWEIKSRPFLSSAPLQGGKCFSPLSQKRNFPSALAQGCPCQVVVLGTVRTAGSGL